MTQIYTDYFLAKKLRKGLSADYTDFHRLFLSKKIKKGLSTDDTDFHWLFLSKKLRKGLSTDYTDLHRLFFYERNLWKRLTTDYFDWLSNVV